VADQPPSGVLNALGVGAHCRSCDVLVVVNRDVHLVEGFDQVTGRSGGIREVGVQHCRCVHAIAPQIARDAGAATVMSSGVRVRLALAGQWPVRNGVVKPHRMVEQTGPGSGHPGLGCRAHRQPRDSILLITIRILPVCRCANKSTSATGHTSRRGNLLKPGTSERAVDRAAGIVCGA
jgi:hypothetical protein